MKRGNSRTSSFAIVGPGALGTALAETLAGAGYDVRSIVVRRHSSHKRHATALAKRIHARVSYMDESWEADVVWMAVPDDEVARVGEQLAESQRWKGRVVFHSSGALSSDELSPLRAKGASIASVHPMMTFVHGEAPNLAGVSFAVEGDSAAVRDARAIVSRMGGKPLMLRKQDKVLYHATGSFASPLVIALMSAMEQVGLAAGIPRKRIKPLLQPLLQQTIRNYFEGGAASAFSGPLIRGDVATVRKHLAELKRTPHARAVYVALVRMAVCELPVKNRAALARLLQ